MKMNKALEKFIDEAQGNDEESLAKRVKKAGKLTLVSAILSILFEKDLFIIKSIKIPGLELNSYDPDLISKVLFFAVLYFSLHYIAVLYTYLKTSYRAHISSIKLQNIKNNEQEYIRRMQDIAFAAIVPIFTENETPDEVKEAEQKGLSITSKFSGIGSDENVKKLDDFLYTVVTRSLQETEKIRSKYFFPLMFSEIAKYLLPICFTLYSISIR